MIDLGSGEDTLIAQANDSMTVDLARGFVKGEGLERDTIVRVTVENVEMLFTCYRGDLRFIGDDRANRLVGSGGDDVLRGRGGSDVIRSDGATPVNNCPDPQGNDRDFGGSGADRLSGGEGRDRLDGGSGRDLGNGGDGRDVCISVERMQSCRRAG